MLFIVRKSGQSIIIDNEVEIYVTEIRGGSVKIGVSCPSGHTALRKELYDKIAAENKASAEELPNIMDAEFKPNS